MITLENVLDSFHWVGKTPEEAGIRLEEKYAFSVEFKGLLFGKEIHSGSAFVLKDHIKDIFMIVEDEKWKTDDILERLEELYGPPYSHGEEPYAIANGGVQFWWRFYTGEGTVIVSRGGLLDYSVIRYQLSDPPVLPKKEEEPEKLSVDNFDAFTGYDIPFEKLRSDNLLVMKDSRTDIDLYGIIFDHDGTHYRALLFKNGDIHHDFDVREAPGYEKVDDPEEIYYDKERKEASLIWKTGEDSWILDMDEDFDKEKIKEVRDILMERTQR